MTGTEGCAAYGGGERMDDVKATSYETEPVGMVEIGQRLGVKPDTVSQWWYRSRQGELAHPMPLPRWTVSGYDAWDWHEIEQWARSTRRLTPRPTRKPETSAA